MTASAMFSKAARCCKICAGAAPQSAGTCLAKGGLQVVQRHLVLLLLPRKPKPAIHPDFDKLFKTRRFISEQQLRGSLAHQTKFWRQPRS